MKESVAALNRLRDTRDELASDITKKQKVLASLDVLLGAQTAKNEEASGLSGKERQRIATKRYWEDVRSGRRTRAVRHRRSE